MAYPILAFIFFLSLTLLIVRGVLGLVGHRLFIRAHIRVDLVLVIWFLTYSGFILLLTGPADPTAYPPAATSPYKLPWKGGDRRFVAQGNRSFTSHRGLHNYAWDFVMPTGSKVRASRRGRVIAVSQRYDGIGLKSNYLLIQHADGTIAGYAHIKHKGSRVSVGDAVEQGQVIAESGMVGQTLFPHLHFYVLNREQSSSVPISFNDVPDGIPRAGRFYTSGNLREGP